MSRGKINALEDRAKMAAQGGFDRALVELLDPKPRMWLAVIATTIQVSCFVVFISAGLFVYQHINSLFFAAIFGVIIAGLNWIFNAIVLNGAIPPWLTPGEIEDYDSKWGRKLSTFLIAFSWSMMNAIYFALSVISIYMEDQVKEFISASFIRQHMLGGVNQTAQSMFELGLDKPTLLHLVEYASSSQGSHIFLILLIGINVLILLPIILKKLLYPHVWEYRKLQHGDARGRILAGYEQHTERLKKTLERYDLVPEEYESAWRDPPFNTKSQQHEEPTFIKDEEMFNLFEEGEAKVTAEAKAQEKSKSEGEVEGQISADATEGTKTTARDHSTEGSEPAEGDEVSGGESTAHPDSEDNELSESEEL